MSVFLAYVPSTLFINYIYFIIENSAEKRREMLKKNIRETVLMNRAKIIQQNSTDSSYFSSKSIVLSSAGGVLALSLFLYYSLSRSPSLILFHLFSSQLELIYKYFTLLCHSPLLQLGKLMCWRISIFN